MLPVCVQTIYVSHLEEAIGFYSSALGYEVKATYGACIAQLKTGSTTLILQEIEPGTHPRHPQLFCPLARTISMHPCAASSTQAANCFTVPLKNARSVSSSRSGTRQVCCMNSFSLKLCPKPGRNAVATAWQSPRPKRWRRSSAHPESR